MRRHLLVVVAMAVSTGTIGGALAAEDGKSAPQPTAEACACAAGKITTDAEASRCGALMDAMTPRQVVDLKGQCTAQLVPAGGPDMCFCLTEFHTDRKIIEACEAVVGKNTRPSELARMAAKCR